MNSEQSSNKPLLGVGIVSAFAASLCCITPVLALISGASGVASTFSWMEPFRPYLIAITIAVLGFAWYQKLKPKTNMECACDENGVPLGKDGGPFFKSRRFLAIITVFAILMLAFPYYGQVFYPTDKNQSELSAATNLQEVNFKVSGMTCSSCEEHIKHAVNQVQGVTEVKADYQAGTTSIKYDPARSNKAAIVKAIDATGYKVAGEASIQGAAPHGQAGHVCGPNGCK